MKKSFSNLSTKQIERLAKKNRLASQKQRLVEEEKNKRGTKEKKVKRDYVYVDRSEDPSVKESDHRTIFNAMKQKPFSS